MLHRRCWVTLARDPRSNHNVRDQARQRSRWKGVVLAIPIDREHRGRAFLSAASNPAECCPFHDLIELDGFVATVRTAAASIRRAIITR